MIVSHESPAVSTPVVALVLRSQVTRLGVTHIAESLSEICRVDTDIDGADIIVTALNDAARDEIAVSLTAARERGAKVLVLVDSASGVDLSQAAALRCDGFLDIQDLTADMFADALYRVVRGELPIPAALTKDLLDHVWAGSESSRKVPPVRLTPRESQVLALLVEGLRNKQIASRLGISQHGAKRLVTNVLAKLNCANRTLAVARALRERLCPPQEVSVRR